MKYLSYFSAITISCLYIILIQNSWAKNNLLFDNKIYQIEIIAFNNLEPTAEKYTYNNNLAKKKQPKYNYNYKFNEELTERYLPAINYSLNKIKEQIKQSNNYKLLFYKAWAQKINNSQNSNKEVADHDRITGSINAYQNKKNFYLTLDFLYKKNIDNTNFYNKKIIENLSSLDLNQKIKTAINETKLKYNSIHIKINKAIKYGKINYIDHPLVSFIIKITEI